MTMEPDFPVYNMPVMLGRTVKRRDEKDPSKWVRDESWYSSVREKFFFLFMFFQNYGLLRKTVIDDRSDVDNVVIRFGDFTELGQAFVISRAARKWESSFDRPGTKKKPSDITYLEKELAKLKK